MSFFIPGLGSMYGSRPWKGLLVLAVYLTAWVLLFANWYSVWTVLAIPGSVVWGMWSGHSDAVRWNRQRGIES